MAPEDHGATSCGGRPGTGRAALRLLGAWLGFPRLPGILHVPAWHNPRPRLAHSTSLPGTIHVPVWHTPRPCLAHS
eukprot:198023-Chlamydomonas_euryale.AAC.2